MGKFPSLVAVWRQLTSLESGSAGVIPIDSGLLGATREPEDAEFFLFSLPYTIRDLFCERVFKHTSDPMFQSPRSLILTTGRSMVPSHLLRRIKMVILPGWMNKLSVRIRASLEGCLHSGTPCSDGAKHPLVDSGKQRAGRSGNGRVALGGCPLGLTRPR